MEKQVSLSKSKAKEQDFLKSKRYKQRKENRERKKELKKTYTNNIASSRNNQLQQDSFEPIELIENDLGLHEVSEFAEIVNKFYVPIKGSKANENETNSDSDLDGEEISIGKKEEKRKSKKERKNHKYKLRVADLKLMTNKPELVETWDITAPDPVFLIYLKGVKNSVQVPKHWCNKRKYLQNRRGIAFNTFMLPDYINATGVSKFRDPDLIDNRILKVKAKDKVNPKINKLDLDYNLLYDAFFIHQTKPKLSMIGDIYYEGKEFSNKMSLYKPGRISEKLRAALGMTESMLPPWLLNMQRFGPPQAYPNLRIPGINCQELSAATPNLWKPPIQDKSKVFVYNTKLNKGQGNALWGEMIEKEDVEVSEAGNELSLDEDDLKAETQQSANANMHNQKPEFYSEYFEKSKPKKLLGHVEPGNSFYAATINGNVIPVQSRKIESNDMLGANIKYDFTSQSANTIATSIKDQQLKQNIQDDNQTSNNKAKKDSELLNLKLKL